MKRLTSSLFLTVCFGLACPSLFAQGIPEPGIVLYGRVLANDGTSSVPANAVTVQLSSIRQAVNAEVTPGRDGFHYYIAKFPFESVLPGRTGSSSVPDLPTAPQTYQLETNTSVEANGERDSNPSVAETGGSTRSFTFGGPGARGGVFRMDLITTFSVHDAPDYNTWANEFFGTTTGIGAPDADPDGDGHVNEFERIAGLDPTSSDPNDPMSRFVLEVGPDPQSPGTMVVSFRPKVPGRSYEVRRSPSLGAGQDWRTMPAALQQDAPLPGAPGGVVQGVLQDVLAPVDQGFYDVQIELEP